MGLRGLVEGGVNFLGGRVSVLHGVSGCWQ